jgi:ferritin-like metal-binding protein YciE
MSIRIIEVFVKLRKMLTDNMELRLAIEQLERKSENHTKNLEIVFRYLDELLEKKENTEPRKMIGYLFPSKKEE